MNQTGNRLCQNIWYLPASEQPLSADVVFIDTPEFVCIYDVGSSEEARLAIEGITKKKIVVLSHFHPDHTANVPRITFDRLYGGRETIRHTGVGQCVDEPVRPRLPEPAQSGGGTGASFTPIDTERSGLADGGLPLSIVPVPSSHAKGSLLLCAGTEYAFCGDALYTTTREGRPVYNAGQLKAMIELLEHLKVKMLALSHDKDFLHPREEVLDGLRQIYARRDRHSSYIDAE
ncbi:MAG: MBL fold metallo-hydrolase [Lachnospiraceae bacterium]|nr:MBL fold metallo-hydrolase [Lachnospiraceae bacterium]